MTDELLLNIKNTLSADNNVRSQAEANLNAFKDENIKELISALIQIISSDYFKEDEKTYQATLIFAWNLFPRSVNDIPEDPQLHPFVIYSEELVQQLLECSFALMTNKRPNGEEVPSVIRNLSSILYGQIGSVQVHYDVNVRLVQALSEVLAEAQTPEDVFPVSQALMIICEEFTPESDEVSNLFNVLFNLFESVEDISVLSQLLDVLNKTITSLTEALRDEEILQNTITTLMNLSTVDGLQASAFKVWDSIYKNDEENGIIMLVADQLVEILLLTLADENKSEDDIKEACNMVKHIAKLEINYDSEEFAPISSNAQPLVIALIRVCCTAEDDSCEDNSYWLPYMAASKALKKVFCILPDEVLESIFQIVTDLVSSEEFNARFGGLIVLSRIIKYADNEFIGFQFIQSLFEILESEKAAIVIYQAIKCIRHVILRYADALSKEEPTSPSQEIVDNIPQICENCFNLMMQILVISDEEAQEGAPQIGDLKALAEQTTVNLSLFSRNGNDDDDDEYLYSPIALQAASLLAEISRTQDFEHTAEVLVALFENGLKYKVPKFFIYLTKAIDMGSDINTILKFLETILEALQTTIQSESTIWALNEIAEIIQAYFVRFQEQLEPCAIELLQLLIQAMQVPSDYAADALIPIGMLALNFPSVFVNTNISDGQEQIPSYLLTLNTLAQAMKDVESSDMIYKASMCLWYIIKATTKDSKEDQQSIGILANDLAQMTVDFINILTVAIADLNLTLEARRSCLDCIADFAAIHPEFVSPLVDQFVVFLRTCSIIQALNVSYITNPTETQLMINALARCTLNIMRIVGPQEAMNYADIAKDLFTFVGDLTEKDGTMQRSVSSILELLYFLSELDKNFILTIIEEDDSVGSFIVTARDCGMQHAQEILDVLGYTE